jgi:hypothetical protein
MSVGKDFKALVDDPKSTYHDIRTFLEKLAPAERREAIEAAGGKRRQARLFELAGEGPEAGLDDLIPQDKKQPLQPVIFYGKNSLPTFSIFQKRFCRAPSGDELIGYNHQAMSFFTGPGYFVARSAEGDESPLGGVTIDYNRVPAEKPSEWPAIKGNDGGIGRMVYGRMLDYLRPLGGDVYIGRAVRKGKLTDNYFLLAREPLE